MSLFYKIKDEEEAVCECEHDHAESHGGHAHSHACGCEGEEQDVRKLIGGVAVFILAVIVFNIPGLFKSISESMMETVELVVFLLIYLVTARDIVVGAIKNLFKGKALDEQFLMSVASLGAFFVGEYSEACAVMLFYLVGEAFQDYAVDRSKKSITDLMDIRPDYANLMKSDGSIETVDPGDVKIGQIIFVKPGEKIPLDGIITDGQGSIDTSALTGESLPREISEGDPVLSGSISLNGAVSIKVTKEFGESTVSKILELVQNAGNKKANTEKFITRFAKVYTPIVVGLAASIAVIPPLLNVIAFGGNIGDFYGVWNDWIYRALTFLVISCPCALVISVPLSFFAGVGAASTKGILIKGSNYLEAMAKCDTVVFDKTGTLTEGVFKINKINSSVPEKEFLECAAAAEMSSNHPIAKSIKERLADIDKEKFDEILKDQREIETEEIHGKGIRAKYKDNEILAGNSKLMESQNIEYDSVSDIGTVVYVAKNGHYLGYAVIADSVKETSQNTIKRLKKLGVKRTVMLTGDRKEIAEHIAEKIGLDEYYAELMPADKVDHVEELLKESWTLAFVGDGINDAPVLARADIGIAMGAMRSDAAIEAADLVLMDDNPFNIVKSIIISRKTIGIAKQNIIFALTVKVAVLILAAFGLVSMWAAVFADVGVCVIAIINAMRTSSY